MVKWAVGIFVLFGVGFWVGRTTAPVPSPEALVEENSSDELAALKRRIAELESQVHSQTVTAPLKQASSDPATESPIPSTVERAESAPEVPVASPKKTQWRAAEKNIAQIRNPQEVGQFLERVKIEDFMLEMQSVQPFTANEEVLEYLNGSFTGQMTSTSEVASFNVALTANVRVEGQKLKGRTNIRLSRNGRTFSRGSSNGDIESVQRFKEKSMAVVIYSGDYYFQLYYMPTLETFEGNCYQQFKPGQMRYLGTVHLERI